MNRKLDLSNLLLFAALLFGIIVRFYPAVSNGFPLNDGGMFYVMTQDIKSNGFQLPEVTTYNQAEIPFAYPPFGFYAAALLSALEPGSDISIFLYLPAVVNSLAVLAFYLLTKELLNSRLHASLATLMYALSPQAFVWQVMGGGLTRSFGILFLLLMLWQAVVLFRSYQNKALIFTILFGAGAALSHPQTALHAALGGALLFLFYSRSKRGVMSAILAGLGVALLTAPWWATTLARHGLEPFLSAGGTSPRTLESYLSILKPDQLEDYIALPILLLGLIGIFFIKPRTLDVYFLITWGILAPLVDPRGGEGIGLLAFTMLAGVGLVKLSGWISKMDGKQAEDIVIRPFSLGLVMLLMTYLLFGSVIFDFRLLNTALKADDLAMIEWVKSNVQGGKTFLLATGAEFSMSDPLQEWFPALTGQKSMTTMQGLEWTYGEKFFPWYDELIAFQRCEDVDCINAWSTRNGVEYEYLVVLIPDEADENEALKNLGVSVMDSDAYTMVYESGHAYIFELKK